MIKLHEILETLHRAVTTQQTEEKVGVCEEAGGVACRTFEPWNRLLSFWWYYGGGQYSKYVPIDSIRNMSRQDHPTIVPLW